VAERVRVREERRGVQTDQGAGEGERPAQAPAGGEGTGHRHPERGGQGKILSPEPRRRAVRMAVEKFGASERFACALLGQNRSAFRKKKPGMGAEKAHLRTELRAVAGKHPAWGWRKARWHLLAPPAWDGVKLNRKRVRRLWRDEDCARLSFFESTTQVPRRARSTGRLRDQYVEAVIRSGRAGSEAAAAFVVSWWMVRAALNEACILTLSEVDELNPRILGIDEHRFRSVRYFRDPASSSWIRHEPWMSTIVDLDTGQALGVVDGRDHKGVGDWLFARPLAWRLGVQVVAIDPSAAFSKALRMWLPRTAVAVDHFHLVSWATRR
jgi:hypothetical protein